MSNNLNVVDGLGAQQIIKTTETGNVHTTHHLIDGTVTVTGALTDTQLRATPVPVSGTVTTGGLTDTQLRATPITSKIGDGTNTAVIQVGSVNGEKGVRVFIGPTDPISDLPVFVDFDHHQNHEGEAYQYYYYNATLNGTVDFRLVVPAYATAIRAPHFSLELICDNTADLFIFEAPTVTGNGSEVTTVRNRNRLGTPNVPGMKIYTGATYSGTGTELARYITIASARASVATDTSKAEWILKPSTEYLVRLTTVGAAKTLLRMNWYEDLGV